MARKPIDLPIDLKCRACGHVDHHMRNAKRHVCKQQLRKEMQDEQYDAPITTSTFGGGDAHDAEGESAKHGDDGKEPAKVHLQEKGNRAAKRRRKHLYKKLNHRKGFRHGQG